MEYINKTCCQMKHRMQKLMQGTYHIQILTQIHINLSYVNFYIFYSYFLLSNETTL